MVCVPSSEAAPRRPIPAANGDTLGGLVLPVEARTGDLTVRALQGWHWRVQSTQRLALRGDVRVELAGWSFEGDTIVLWVERIPSDQGPVTQVAIWVPDATAHAAAAGGGTSGDNLLVVGAIRGETVIDVAAFSARLPNELRHLVERADDRLADYVDALQNTRPILETHPTVVPPPAIEDDFVPIPGKTIAPGQLRVSGQASGTAGWLQRPGATLDFSADHVTVDKEDGQPRILADGNVVVHYRPRRRGDRLGALRMSSERMVLYLVSDEVEDTATSLQVSDVKGVYLEGAVVAEAERDDYTVRSPRMYYDFQMDRAIMVDAVLRTYDRERRVPVYARADELRQVAEDQWTGKGARVSASSFAVPTLAIGAEQVTITKVPGSVDDNGQLTESYIEVEGVDNTLRAGGVPFFYWPYFKGNPDDMPLVGQSTSFENYQGIGIEARWNLLSLLGEQSPHGDTLTLETAGYTKRGVALGLNWAFNREGDHGNLDLWGIHDSGTQRLATGLTQEVPKTWRGIATWEDTVEMGNDWIMQSQISLISDSTFVSAWRDNDFQNRREYETSFFTKQDKEDTSVSFLAEYAMNPYVSNSWLLASQGFQLNQFPKFTFRKVGTDLFKTLTWSGDVSYNRFKASIPRGTAAENGITPQVFQSPDVAMNANQDIAFALGQQGINSNWATRVTSTHHLTMPVDAGPFEVTPFASGQIQNFFQHETAVPGADLPDFRAVGGVGVHATTSFQRVYNDVHSDTLGLHRLRWLIDPWVRGWTSAANFNPLEQPDYEPFIDATAKGSAIQMGMRHRLQTQRGGAGRWYDADWADFSVAATFSTDEATRRWYTPRWEEANPLLSSFGNYVRGTYKISPAEALTFTGEGTWDLDLNGFTRGAVAMNIDHSPRLRTGVSYRYFEVPDDYAALFPTRVKSARGQMLGLPVTYEISKAYVLRLAPQYNFSEQDFQKFSAVLTRRLPDFDLVFYVNYDEIRGETVGGVRIANPKF
ncbi:MAG: hypothetical protein MK077_01340 [Phycisphaerales bacterium]|nr:hypothetical protein [Phycisphaerales bacterium]